LTKGQPWSVETEKLLRELAASGADISVIAGKLGKSRDAILKKAERLGLEVVGGKGYATTTSLEMPKELPSVEEALKMLAAALKAACTSGLDKVEVQRLQVVATLARTYKDLLVDYINYRAIEVKLVELEANYAKIVKEKAQGHESKPDSSRAVSASAK
jgi:hypothetical protein